MNETIIIFGDDPRGFTGFGRITNHLADAVTQAGYTPVTVALKSGYNIEYSKSEVYNVKELSDPQGWKTLENIIIQENAKTVISIGDPWDLQGIPEIKQRVPFSWIGCTPVDFTPYSRYILLVQNPQQYLDTASLLYQMNHIVTYSDFGKIAVDNMLGHAFTKLQTDIELPETTRIYLGVDRSVYFPKDKNQSRKVFSGGEITDDTVLFSCIKVNSIRSGFDTLLEAWAKYLEKSEKNYPDLARRSKLYLHTNIEGSGYPIPVIMKRYNIENSILLNTAIKAGAGVPEEDMSDLYNSTDIGLSTARGEGFGLNILEALSCGVPCIVPDYGCPAEYGGDALERVPVAATYNPDFATTDFAIANSDIMAEMMFSLAADNEMRNKMGKKGTAIADSLTWEKFILEWKMLIISITADN